VRTPSAAELVRVWELGFGRVSWYQAVLLLAPAFPASTFDALAALSVGERNVRLIALRARLFGSSVEATVACPRCSVPLEFAFDVLELCPPAHDPEARRPAPFDVALDDELTLTCRPATTADLAALPGGDSPAQRGALIQRLVLAARRAGELVDPPELDECAAERIASALEDADPFAQTLMAFACAACGHEWNAPFDVVSFLWSEVTTQVHRILEDVQRLARSYGWSEGSILAMTGVRRRFYLERVS
jgi:hypothetical protein